jgi:hypothetical protein
MKKTYETPQIIVTAFEGENTMTLTASNVSPANVKKTSSNSFSFGQLGSK